MTAESFPFGFVALAVPFIAALLAPSVVRSLGGAAAWCLAAMPAAGFILLASRGGILAAGGTLLFGVDWVPALGVRLAFRLDGLSLAFSLLVTGIGALVVLYSAGYLKDDPRLGRFLGFVFLFMGAMLGLVLADDLLTLAVFWEGTSIASFLLIGFDNERERARRAALQALVVTGAGGLALLAAVVLVRQDTGFASFTQILADPETLRESGNYGAILVLVLIAAFTKSAQFPFQFWLPNAMEAPTPVSAYLHSATMVKAGVYLLMRLNPALGGTAAWETVLPLFGGATLLLGAAMAMKENDLKLVLAHTTVASLGLLVMLLGLGREAAVAAAVLYLLAHALFKGALFMVAGCIDHGAGTRDLAALGGLRRAMPVTFAAALLGALSMSGVAPFLGFLAKEEVYLATGTGPAMLAALVGNALMVAATLLVALRPFTGRRPDSLRGAHENGALLLTGPLLLGVVGLLAGPFAHFAFAWIAEPMARAVAGRPVAIEASAVPHLGWPFALSLLTLGLGSVVFLAAPRLRRLLAGFANRIGWGFDRGFDQGMTALLAMAHHVTRRSQNGRLDSYMRTAFVVVALALLAPPIWKGALPAWPAWPSMPFAAWTAALLLAAGVAVVLAARDRLTAIVALGVQGLAVALLFMLAGAPDLAFTQLMIETLSVVVLALAMTRLHLDVADARPPREKLGGGVVALACGVGFTLLMLAVAARPLDTVLSDFFERYSYAIAHGRNVVNVVIVDFRGLDTLGEIAVVFVAGLAILALLGIRRKEPTPG